MRIAVLLVLACLSMTSTQAADLLASEAWVREPPPGRGMTAGYLVLENPGEQPLRLVAVSSDSHRSVSLHRTVEVEGVLRMRELDGVTVPPGGSVQFEPGGLHLMLMGATRRLTAGEVLTMRLQFESGEALPVDFEVRGLDR